MVEQDIKGLAELWSCWSWSQPPCEFESGGVNSSDLLCLHEAIELLGYSNIGTLKYWGIGILGYWNLEILKYWNTIILF